MMRSRSETAMAGRIIPLILMSALLGCGSPEAPTETATEAAEPVRTTLRFATFNIKELGREKLDSQSLGGFFNNPQLANAAQIIQRIRPDVLLINEIDFDSESRENATHFVRRFLKIPQGGRQPIDYPYVFFAPSNTGEPSGHDFDNDDKTDGPGDAYGFGRYPGQYAMALLSRLPIDTDNARTFQHLLWRDMPGNLMPDGQDDGRPDWYNDEEARIFRLSSKSHWDVPIRTDTGTVHVLASHPTPPVFDGDEDRNGRRNFDEIRLWADYLTGGEGSAYIVDDAGTTGGLAEGAHFVIMGDLNADPFVEPTYGRTAISQLLEHPRVHDPKPKAEGGAHAERAYAGPGELRTAAFGRIDYVLPSRTLELRDSGIFWPGPQDPLHRLVMGEEGASDHALVWVDFALP